MVLDMGQPKNNKRAIFDLSEYAPFTRGLAAAPFRKRNGPVVVDEHGNLFQRRYYNALYRELADTQVVPKGVWNMNARHGGATEARQSGALLEHTSSISSTANLLTNRGPFTLLAQSDFLRRPLLSRSSRPKWTSRIYGAHPKKTRRLCYDHPHGRR